MSVKVLLPAILLPLLHACLPGPEDKVNDPDLLRLEACVTQTNSHSLEIITWNVREFPIHQDKTIRLVADIIRRQDPDLIAFQEITNEEDFGDLIRILPGWDGVMVAESDLNPAFLYKLSEIKLIGSAIPLFQDDKYNFPRAPLMISVEHQSGLRIFLINIHLKCCSGVENEYRREMAGEKLKKYLDDKLPMEKVILLGDFNDEIISHDGTRQIFSNFIKDSLHYAFTDMEIAGGDSKLWSYPGWPSHIDHILITDELFEIHTFTRILAYDACDTAYLVEISDHRPMMIRFK
jgi:endonuclease/exonuclease/phosphatase family metal-dependent hydrolase